MAKKPKATKTINPLHFEDLEPHRFEDLVRRLLYTFRDWSNIEATGRAGSDEGFDVRAWERGDQVINVSEEGDEGVRSLEGHLWQVQGKREKSITPAKMGAIIKDGVDAANPPYGYILAAATNVSKGAYDVFREELRKKHVVEFYFWGKDHLEDQLSLPQNDEILFTFFGISLSPRKRSRTAELKFSINNKNKILKLVFDRDDSPDQGVRRTKRFLLRDVNASEYPDRRGYPDFVANPRWEEYNAVDVTATGVYFRFRERYAYLDQGTKQYDVSMAIDLIRRRQNNDEETERRLEDERRKAERYWRHLPYRMQAKVEVDGFVPFEDMLIIDDKGDPEYTDPHLFVDYGSSGPFKWKVARIGQRGTFILPDDLENDFKRAAIFPSTFPAQSMGTIYDLSNLELSDQMKRRLETIRGSVPLLSFNEKLNLLEVGDIIHVPRKGQDSLEKHAEITHIYETSAGALQTEGAISEWEVERAAGRTVPEGETVKVYEVQEVYLPDSGDYLIYASDDRT